MPEDPTLDADAQSSHTQSGTNGVPHADRDALAREVVMLRARCSNLRHWCRLLLNDPAATGALTQEIEAELRATAPEVTEPEGQVVVALLARGGNVPPNHPLAPPAIEPANLRATIARLSPECERLRKAFFTLYDYLHPDDDLTEEFFLEQRAQGPGPSIAELIAQFEREPGVTS